MVHSTSWEALMRVLFPPPGGRWLRRQWLAAIGLAVIALALGAPPRAIAGQPAGAHPQALTDQAGLARLRAARTGDHVWLADQLKPFLERYVNGTVDVSGVGAYALGAEVFQDQRYI